MFHRGGVVAGSGAIELVWGPCRENAATRLEFSPAWALDEIFLLSTRYSTPDLKYEIFCNSNSVQTKSLKTVIKY